MTTNYTNSDRILQAVLKDAALVEYGHYDPDDYDTLESALMSDNYTVCAVARIIDRKNSGKTDKEI